MDACSPELESLLLDCADTADGGTAVGALALHDGLAVLGQAFVGFHHDLLRLALHAVCFDFHFVLIPSQTGMHRARPTIDLSLQRKILYPSDGL